MIFSLKNRMIAVGILLALVIILPETPWKDETYRILKVILHEPFLVEDLRAVFSRITGAGV